MCAQLEEMIHELAMHVAMWSGYVFNDTIKRTLFAFIDVDSMSITFLSLSPSSLFLENVDTHVRLLIATISFLAAWELM